MDAKDNAYLEFLEAQFEEEKRETRDKAARRARRHSRADMHANSSQREWVFWLLVLFWTFVAMLVVALGTVWFWGLPVLALGMLTHLK